MAMGRGLIKQHMGPAIPLLNKYFNHQPKPNHFNHNTDDNNI